MLLPQPSKKPKQSELPPQLDTPEQVTRSIEHDHALTVRAQRQQAESAAVSSRVAAKRDRFELTRDQIRFAFELIGVVVALIVMTIIVISKPELLPVTLLSGGGLGGIAAALHKRS